MLTQTSLRWLTMLLVTMAFHDLAAVEAAPPTLKRSLSGGEWVTSMSCSPDGKTLATGDWGESIRLWDLDTGKVQFTLPGHGKLGSYVAYSPDGKRLASAGRNSTVKIWDAVNGELKSQVESDEYPKVVAFSPDGATLVIGGSTLRICDVASAKITVALEIERDINAMAMHPEGKCVATASGFVDVVTLYDLKTGKSIANLRPQTRKVRNSGPVKGTQLLSFSPDGKLLASIGDDDSIWIWDWAERRERHVLRGHKTPIYAVAFSPDGSHLICTCQESALEVWEVKTGKVVSSAKPTETAQSCIAFLEKGKSIVTGDWNGKLNIWDLALDKRETPAR